MSGLQGCRVSRSRRNPTHEFGGLRPALRSVDRKLFSVEGTMILVGMVICSMMGGRLLIVTSTDLVVIAPSVSMTSNLMGYTPLLLKL